MTVTVAYVHIEMGLCARMYVAHNFLSLDDFGDLLCTVF